MAQSNGGEALSLTVDTTIPDYILDDHINLTGTTSGTVSVWQDDDDSDFSGGQLTDLTVDSDSVVLKPELDLAILNNGNAVLKPSSSGWDKNILHCTDVVRVKGTYFLYYTSAGASFSDPRHIGVATSTDGVTFTKRTDPVISSRSESYDYQHAMQPTVIYEDGTFKMWYAGKPTSSSHDICYATSSDGINWTKYSGNPVLKHAGGWSSDGVRPMDILNESGTYKLFMFGDSSGDHSYGYATSTDGTSWTYYSGNPVRSEPSTGWQNGLEYWVDVEKDNGSYRVWITGNPNGRKVGYLVSDDCKSWTDVAGVVFSPKANTIYEKDINAPEVIDNGDHYLAWMGCTDSKGLKTVGAFKITPKKMDGTYLSKTFDEGGKVIVRKVEWALNEPIGTSVTLSIRWSNTTGSWSGWTPLVDSGVDINVTARYFQYRALFTASKDWMRPSLEQFKMNYRAPVTAVEVSVDGGVWTPADGTLAEWNLSVPLHEGDYDIQVRAFDLTGKAATRTLPVKVDHTPPVGTITLEGGAEATDSALLHFQAEATDLHGITDFKVSTQPDLSDATWTSYYPLGAFDHQGEDGDVTLYAMFRDGAGRVSEIVNDTIVVDTTPPEGSLTINDGEEYTTTGDVSLALDWTDLTGIASMKVSNDPNFLGADWRTPVTQLDWALQDVDGTRHVYVRLVDAVGHVSDLADDIVLDTTPPRATVLIEEGSPYATGTNVSLSLTWSDANPAQVKLANGGEAWSEDWSTIGQSEVMDWALAAGPDGPRSVRLLVRDAAGHETEVSDDIVLDATTPEGTIIIDSGATFTSDLLVSVELNATDATSGLDGMRVSSTDDFSTTSWQSVKDRFDWTLQAGDGSKSVFVQLRDRAGLVAVIDAGITLDQTRPAGDLRIDGGAAHTRDQEVSLALNFSDAFGLDAYRVSAEPTFAKSQWRPYADVATWTLTSVEGEHTVYVGVRDLAGNVLATSASIVLDLTDPALTVTLQGGAEATLNDTVELAWTASDLNGLSAFRISSDASMEGVAWTAITGEPREESSTIDWSLSEGAGLKEVHVQVRDVSGRTRAASDGIWYVPERPRGSVTIGDGSGWTNTTTVAVSVELTGGAEATHARFATAAERLPTAEWVPVSGTQELELPWGDGPKTVHVQLREAHNVTSEPFTGDVLLDTLPPQVAFTDVVERVLTEGTHVFNVSSSDGMSDTVELHWRLDGGAWQQLSNSSIEVELEAGERTLELRGTDDAGNEAVSALELTVVARAEAASSSWLLVAIVIAVVAAACAGGLVMMQRRGSEGGV